MRRKKNQRKPWFRDADGWWYGQVGKNSNRRYQRLIEGKENGREARRLYKDLLEGTPDEISPDSPVIAIFKRFLKEHVRHECSEGTYAWYRWFLKGFAKRIGKLPASKLKPIIVTEYLNSKKTWGPTTRNRAITCIKVAINWAVNQGILKDSPLKNLKKPPIARRERILSSTDRKTIIRAIKDRPFKLFLFALGQTGARPSEIRRVTAAHFHPSGVWIFPKKEHKTGKKTGKPRVVYLTPPMVKLCQRLIREHPGGPLFRNTRGKPWSQNAIRLRFQRLRERVPGLEGVVSYVFRHSFTTDALETGIPIATVSELLGHTSTRMVESFYSHLGEKAAHLQQAARKAVTPTPRRPPTKPAG